MKLSEFKSALALHPESTLRFVLPDGEAVPAHAHVTEVARVAKRYVDCGGTLRDDVLCRLQTWVAGDLDHRLTARKLSGILAGAAATVLGADDLELDVEHEVRFVSQFPVVSVEAKGGELLVRLGERHTACLAEDKCLPKPAVESISFKKSPALR